MRRRVPRPPRTRLAAPVVGLALALGLTACMDDDPAAGRDGDPGAGAGDAATRLEQQRDDVRAAARDLLPRAADALAGRSDLVVGRFEGCTSKFPEGYASFQYRLNARLTAGDDRRPYLDRLRGEVDDATQEEVPGGASLRGTTGGVEVSLTEREAGGRVVVVTVAGPCVDVPEDDSDAWLRRDADRGL